MDRYEIIEDTSTYPEVGDMKGMWRELTSTALNGEQFEFSEYALLMCGDDSWIMCQGFETEEGDY